MDDRKIIRDIIDGDKEKYRELIQKYQDRLINFIFAMTKDYDEAQEITQIAFIKAYSSLKKYNPHYQFSTWLYRIAINQAKSHFRKNKTISINEAHEKRSDENLEKKMQKEYEKVNLQKAIDTLDKNYQLVINMYYWQDLNYQQISDILQVPLGTVRTWIRRAKIKLKEKLDGQI